MISATAGAELALDLLQGDVGVLDHVVEESRRQGGLVHLHVGQDVGDPHGVEDELLAAAPQLVGMVGARELVGLTDDPGVALAVIGAHLLYERVDGLGQRGSSHR